MKLRVVFIFGNILISSLLALGESPAVDDGFDAEELADSVARAGQVSLNDLSEPQKEALIEVLSRRHAELQPGRSGRYPLEYWRYAWSLLRLEDLASLKRIMDDHREPHPYLRRTFSEEVARILRPDELVFVVDDFLFVDEEIDWAKLPDFYTQRSMRSLAEIAAEQLDWYVVRHPTRRERFAEEVREFIDGMRGMYEDERYGHPAPEEMVAAFRDFWKENREHFLNSEYERVELSEETREEFKAYQQAAHERYMRR